MAAAGTSPALNLREKLAELAGLKQRVSPDLVRCDFGNLVTNGGFDTDTDWTKDASGNGAVTISSGTLNITSSGGTGYPTAYQAVTTTVGQNYTITASWSANTTGVWIRKADDFGPSSSNASGEVATNNTAASGTGSASFLATAVASYINIFSEQSDAGSVVVDNVSLYEADPSDDAPWLRLPYGYKVGQRGMIVRDGVVLHPSDYTEITDSGQTFIKPIVAPGASTEFSIWAGA